MITQQPLVKEVEIRRILNPTSIELGEYVINPYMGCAFSCLYCYVRSNRVVSRKKEPWGEYVDVRVNAPGLLEKELVIKKTKVVLLGSTTECFQPLEKKYRITRKIIEILNNQGVYYVILTRSPLILDYLALLKKGFCRKVYFTLNNFSSEFKERLEPKSPGFDLRLMAIEAMLDEGIPVVPYFSPLLPWISDYKFVFSKLIKARSVEFECLNFRLNNIEEIISKISEIDMPLAAKYKKILCDKSFYAQTFNQIKDEIDSLAKEAGKNFNIYIHSFGNYFVNRY